MSRHSRNNTANSVFTYAEKKMLDKDYGVKKARIGQDSQRNFEQCHLCLVEAKDPVACLRGHIFCRECIMSNMLDQKKALEAARKVFEEEKNKQELKGFLQKRRADEKETAEFEKDTLELGSLAKVKAHQREFLIKSKFTDEDYEELRRQQIVAQIQDKKTLGFDNHEMKRELIQSSFWLAESNKDRLEALDKTKKPLEEKQPRQVMLCPGDNQHTIKLKDFFPLSFEAGRFVCFASKKQLKFQQMIAVRTCGHVFVKEAFKKCVGDSLVCLCGKQFLEGDLIDIVPANSAFAEHNEVEARVYEPSFAV
jgi:nitric oxide synthase-interacting protein